jgi:hypothetical protein
MPSFPALDRATIVLMKNPVPVWQLKNGDKIDNF